jgi:hypothetical protein
MTAPAADSNRYQGQYWAVAGLIAAAGAIWVLPLLLGPAGMICGGLAVARGERRGRWVVLLAALGLVLGLLVGLIPDHILFSE